MKISAELISKHLVLATKRVVGAHQGLRINAGKVWVVSRVEQEIVVNLPDVDLSLLGDLLVITQVGKLRRELNLLVMNPKFPLQVHHPPISMHLKWIDLHMSVVWFCNTRRKI